MMINKYFRTATLTLCTLSIVILPIRSAHAFSGGVTTYTKPTADTVERARTFPAKTPELDQTYQRTMRAAASKVAVASAMRKALRGFVEKIPVLGALAVLAVDIYGIWSKKDDGTNVLTVPGGDPAICTVAPCSEYLIRGEISGVYRYGSFKSTPEQSAATLLSSWPNDYYPVSLVSCSLSNCTFTRPGSGERDTVIPLIKRSIEPTAPDPNAGRRTVGDAELEDLLKADKPFIPVLKQMDDLGFPVPFPSPEVEDMPQPIAISPVTTTHSDGSKTISQTTLEPYRADNNEVQWRKKETVTEVSKPAADGTTTTKTDTTTTDSGKSSTPEKAPDEPATDTPLPAQPKLYKQRYPDGLTGVWKTQHDLMVATPLFTLAKGLMPTVANSGQCPTMPVNLTFSKWANFGVKDLAPPCQVWDWGRAICIVSALLLARQLIFGG